MSDERLEDPRSPNFGAYLKHLREGRRFSLRAVEEITGRGVSNAYLSQLENGSISKPSPNILYSLSEAYGVPYEGLMERAGYLAPASTRVAGEKHGRAATFAIENLTAEEEKELLDYLSWYRSRRVRGEETR